MEKREIIIDGSEGEGGGQVLRSSVSLSAITGTPVRIENIRAGRRKPGLMRQHLTAIRAAAEICDAELEGGELGAREISFIPGKIKGGDYRFQIGTAGATTLVAQTVLPILSHADTDSTVSISGGTHAAWAPTFDYIDRAFLPQFREMGGRAAIELAKYGFYPAGGGEINLTIKPIKTPARLDLTERGDKVSEHILAVVSNLPWKIADREVKTALRLMNLDEGQGEAIQTEGQGPGNVISLFSEYENVTEVFIGLGEHGVRAEQVAKSVVKEAREFISSKAAVGPHLADQLLLPMALLKGGSFTTTELTQHTLTNIDIIKRFVDVDIETRQLGKRHWLVEVSS